MQLKDELMRSDMFHNGLRAELLADGEQPIPVDARSIAGFAYCKIALEHGSAFQFLLNVENPISAIALVRLQFEAVLRCTWIRFAASDQWMQKFSSRPEFNVGREPAEFPRVHKILEELAASPADPVLYQSLATLKEKSWDSLNSYTHGGLRMMIRVLEGFDDELLHWMLRTTNSLSYVAAQHLAQMTQNPACSARLNAFRQSMPDCMHQQKAPG